MLEDRYGYPITTRSPRAAEAYIAASDRLLAAEAGIEKSFREATAADPDFALARIGFARTLQMLGHKRDEMKEALRLALTVADRATERERSHIAIFEKILTGQSLAAIPMIEAHVKTWPRDAMAVAPATGVFGLIGFSGEVGREERQLAILEPLAPHYGDDWWYLTVLAFAEGELQQHGKALRHLESALASHPRNAHAAHVRAHVFYEMGEREQGLPFLTEWYRDYPRGGQLHCHIGWHLALWSLETGRVGEAWRIYRETVHPGGSWGPAINALTDGASFLLRAEMAGEARQPDLWRELADYAARSFPRPGLTFVDVHGALAYAMAGDDERLRNLIAEPRGAAADLLPPIAEGFAAFAQEDWARAVSRIAPTLETHERIGGSRAQRDLLEFTAAYAMARGGDPEGARRQIATRRPQDAAQGLPLAGM